jgi:8-oxo-dGTP pyrophosphatase MutT (NUDIX family)
MASEKLFHVGVKALIVDQRDRVLLLQVNTEKFKKDKTPHWDIPGGRIQQGQTALETLQREVAEETGIGVIVKAEYLTGVISNIEIPISDELTVGLVLVVYKVSIPEHCEVVLSEEHTAYEWVPRAEAAKRLQFKYPAEFTKVL